MKDPDKAKLNFIQRKINQLKASIEAKRKPSSIIQINKVIKEQ